MPHEGEAALAIDGVDREAPVCSPSDSVKSIAGILKEYGYFAVVNAERVVVGRVRAGDVNADSSALPEALMEEGPTTIRPSEELAAVTHRMEHAGVHRILVTSSDGRLIGVLDRDRIEQNDDVDDFTDR